MNVKLSEEQKIKVLNADDIFKIMQQILMRENKIRRGQEHFWIVGLNTRNKILFIELVALGATNRVNVKPPELYRMAIYKLAVSVILVHNHPSGENDPSPQDKDLTDYFYKTGKLLNIEVLDHLVISETGFFSFEDAGLMEKIKKSGHYEISPREAESLKKMQEEMLIEAAQHEEKRRMAKMMKKDGYEVEVIKRLTGLGKKEIEGL